jgi:hypothetical protein
MTRTYSASQESEPNRDGLSESASTERIQFVGVFLEVDLVEHYYVRDGWWAQPRPAKLPQSIPYLDIYLIASVTKLSCTGLAAVYYTTSHTVFGHLRTLYISAAFFKRVNQPFMTLKLASTS